MRMRNAIFAVLLAGTLCGCTWLKERWPWRQQEEPEPVEPEPIEPEPVIPLYDVVTIGGWSMTVAGWEEGHGAGVQTVNGFWGEKNHRLSVGLTREQVEDDMWCWGFGIEPDAKNHFAIVAVAHGNPRRWPMTFPDIWWNYLIPEEQIFARSVGAKYGLGPVCLRLRFGVFEG